MAIRRKVAPTIAGTSLEEVVVSLNRTFGEIYTDINVMNNKLTEYFHMLQDASSGAAGSMRLTRKVTSDASEQKYQLLGKAAEGWVMVQDDLEIMTIDQTADMELQVKNADTDKPKIRTK